MRKAVVLLFAIAMICLDAIVVRHPGSQLTLFMTAHQSFSILRVSALTLALVTCLPICSRFRMLRSLTMAAGLAVFSLGTAFIFSPTLLGHLSFFALPLDCFILIEAGILTALNGLDVEPELLPEPKLVPAPWRHLQLRPAKKPQTAHFFKLPHIPHGWSPRGA